MSHILKAIWRRAHAAIHAMPLLLALLLALPLLLLSSCREMHDPLLHATGKVMMSVEMEQEANIDLMWEPNWRSRWQVDWDEQRRGPIGYTEPETYHYDCFEGYTLNHLSNRDMVGNTVRINLGVGAYDMLFYNNDYQLIRISEAKDWSTVTARTEWNSYAETPATMVSRQGEGTVIRQMPEQLFSVLHGGIEITANLEDYEWILEEGIWLFRVRNILQPRVFIYLVQVELKNNNGRVTDCGSMTMEGLAEAVELRSTLNSTETIAHQFAAYYQETTTAEGEPLCLIGARMTTFGIVGISPWEEHCRLRLQTEQSGTRATLQVAQDAPRNVCHVSLRFANGGRLTVPVDVTDQIWRQPVGGVINIVLDIDDYEEPEPDQSGGGLNLGVGGWGDENHDIII